MGRLFFPELCCWGVVFFVWQAVFCLTFKTKRTLEGRTSRAIAGGRETGEKVPYFPLKKKRVSVGQPPFHHLVP